MFNVDKGTRFINYLSDYLAIFIIGLFMFAFTGGVLTNLFYYYLIMFLYYFLFGVARGQTLSKMITKTKVVSKDGSENTILVILCYKLTSTIRFSIFIIRSGVFPAPRVSILRYENL